MRIRVLGQYIPLSMAAFAAVEGAIFFVALLVAGQLRFGAALKALERRHGHSWPRALVFPSGDGRQSPGLWAL
jgi:hypothetical protein